MKRFGIFTVLAAGALTIGLSQAASAAVYNYSGGVSDLALDNGDWTVQTDGPDFSTYWTTSFNKDTGATQNDMFKMNAPSTINSTSPANVWRGAIFWTAPANEVVTSITFDWWLQASSWRINNQVYTGDNLTDGVKVWDNLSGHTAAAVYSGSQTLTFDVNDNITSIGLSVWGQNGSTINKNWQGRFLNPIITTSAVPEPAGLMILGLGGLLLKRRTRK